VIDIDIDIREENLRTLNKDGEIKERVRLLNKCYYIEEFFIIFERNPTHILLQV